MPRTSLTLGMLAAAFSAAVAGFSSEPAAPAPTRVDASTTSATSATSDDCSVLTTAALRKITAVQGWKSTTVAKDKRGAVTCTWRSGDEGNSVTAVPARDWYTSLASRASDQLDMDDDSTAA